MQSCADVQLAPLAACTLRSLCAGIQQCRCQSSRESRTSITCWLKCARAENSPNRLSALAW
eukprot:10932868-Alexandrium_andersonii.AAC.1